MREAGRGRLRAHPLCINTESLTPCSAMRTRRGGKGMLGSDSFIHPRVRWFVYRWTATERNVRGAHEASLLLGRVRQREEWSGPFSEEQQNWGNETAKGVIARKVSDSIWIFFSGKMSDGSLRWINALTLPRYYPIEFEIPFVVFYPI